MVRKFCRALYDIVQKKGRVLCVEKGCRGYIKKSREEIEAYEFFEEKTEFYKCTKDESHKWNVFKSTLDERVLFLKG